MNLKKILAWAEEAGVSPAEVLFAVRHPWAWDAVFPHGPVGPGSVDPRTLSTEARSELHGKLEEVRSGLMGKVREGDLEAARLAAMLAIQQATLR